MKKTKANQFIVHCPECGKQAKVTTPGLFISSLIGTFLICGPVFIALGFVLSFLIIPALLIPAGAICLVAIPVCLIISPIYVKYGKYVIECKHCNSKFKLNKEEYKKIN